MHSFSETPECTKRQTRKTTYTQTEKKNQEIKKKNTQEITLWQFWRSVITMRQCFKRGGTMFLFALHVFPMKPRWQSAVSETSAPEDKRKHSSRVKWYSRSVNKEAAPGHGGSEHSCSKLHSLIPTSAWPHSFDYWCKLQHITNMTSRRNLFTNAMTAKS